MFTLTILNKTYKISGAIWAVLLALSLPFLYMSLSGLFALIGHWIWLLALVTITWTVNGKSFSLLKPEILNRVVSFIAIWSGFITYWFPTFLIDQVK
jgi:hypothetical protein